MCARYAAGTRACGLRRDHRRYARARLELFPEGIGVGAQFGVILVPRDGLKVEVATFRSDVGYSDGRHPDAVVYAKTRAGRCAAPGFHDQWFTDAPRHAEKFSTTSAAKRICAPASFARSAKRSGVSAKTNCACCARCALRRVSVSRSKHSHISRHQERCGAQVQQVSAERIREELTKMLTEGAAGAASSLLDETWTAAASAAGNFRDAWRRTAAAISIPKATSGSIHMMMLEGLPAGSPTTLAWGVLLARRGQAGDVPVRCRDRRPHPLRRARGRGRRNFRAQSAAACVSPTRTPSRSYRWWPII